MHVPLPRRPRWHVSRRTLYLILFGAAWIVYGLAVHDVPQGASLPVYATVPTEWQGWAWVACGSACVAGAVVPRFPRVVGFMAAVLMPILWSLGFAVAGVGGAHFAWRGAVIWGLFAALATLSAGDEDGHR